MPADYDVFISYRRETGAAEARLIRERLVQENLRVFLDVTDLKKGYFDETLLTRIAETPNFLVVLSPNALDRCGDERDWLRREIARAVETRRNIIPILMPGFHFPPGLPDDIRDLPRHQGLDYSHRYFDSMITAIVEALQNHEPKPEQSTASAEEVQGIFGNPETLVGESIGSYRLGQFIGAGGTGIVYRAVHRSLGRTVALKVFYPLTGSSSRFYELFERGFRALGALSHPNIAQVLDFGSAEVLGVGVLYCAVEYVKGVPLDRWSMNLHSGPEALRMRLKAALQLTEALCAAHETTYTDELGFEVRGVLHGDIKPANVLVDDSGTVKLVDFLLVDLQRLQDPRVVPPQYLQPRGEVPITGAFGTPGFMAPEQQSQGLVATKTDIFGLGVTLSRLFAPTALTGVQTAIALRTDEALPKGLADLLVQMTLIPPDRRPSSMKEVLARLSATYHISDEPQAPAAIAQDRVLEAAAPAQSALGKSTEVVAMVRQTGSQGLRAYLDLEQIPSLGRENVRERPFELEFPRDATGKPQAAEIVLRLDSPDFEPRSQSKKLKVPPRGDSEPCHFLVRPLVTGDLVLNVELLKGEEVVVSRPIRMRAAQDAAGLSAAKSLVSIPLVVVVPELGTRPERRMESIRLPMGAPAPTIAAPPPAPAGSWEARPIPSAATPEPPEGAPDESGSATQILAPSPLGAHDPQPRRSRPPRVRLGYETSERVVRVGASPRSAPPIPPPGAPRSSLRKLVVAVGATAAILCLGISVALWQRAGRPRKAATPVLNQSNHPFAFSPGESNSPASSGLAGTSWQFDGGRSTVVTFLPDGNVRFSDSKYGGHWYQDGDSVTFDSNGYTQYDVKLNGDRMEGRWRRIHDLNDKGVYPTGLTRTR